MTGETVGLKKRSATNVGSSLMKGSVAEAAQLSLSGGRQRICQAAPPIPTARLDIGNADHRHLAINVIILEAMGRR